jgi:SAM-dependent methyltransferase
MVVEHLAAPEEMFREIARILRPGGNLIVHTPNAAAYTTIMARTIPPKVKKSLIRILENRSEEDVFSTFYRANSRRSLARLGRDSGLEASCIDTHTSSAVFALIPPLMVLELVCLRILQARWFAPIRPVIIAVFVKQRSEKPVSADSRRS